MKLGQIVNGIGINLVDSYNKVFKTSGSTSTETTLLIMKYIEEKFSLLLQFLGNEDDDVSASVLEFVRDYLHVSFTYLLVFVLNSPIAFHVMHLNSLM